MLSSNAVDDVKFRHTYMLCAQGQLVGSILAIHLKNRFFRGCLVLINNIQSVHFHISGHLQIRMLYD